MVDAGQAAAWYQDRVFRNLTCKRIQVDEIWAFVYAKQKNVASAKKAPPEAGDVWTWTAIDADTKLIPYGLSAGVTVTRQSSSWMILPPALQTACNLLATATKPILKQSKALSGLISTMQCL
jgi:hypothetical protein